MRSRFSLVMVAMLVLAFAASALGMSALRKPKLTMEQATAIALARHDGTVKSSELEKEHGKLVYSFDIEAGTEIREVQVDAMTGAIVEDKVESAADEAKEAAKDHKKEERTEKEKKVQSTQPK